MQCTQCIVDWLQRNGAQNRQTRLSFRAQTDTRAVLEQRRQVRVAAARMRNSATETKEREMHYQQAQRLQ